MNEQHRKYYTRAMLALCGIVGYPYGLAQGAEHATTDTTVTTNS